MTLRFLKRPRLLGLLAASVVLVLGLIRWRASPSSPDVSFPLPPFSESRFLNAGSEAHYIGVAACAECHPGNHNSYLLTPHSKALSDIDPKAEPPDGAFYHKASGRSYRVYRQGKEFRHAEILRTDEGAEIARVDLPIRYLIGSGHFTRSYLIEIDGFLHESPITWYSLRKKWDVSPGYDSPRHWGFERPVEIGCLHCHAGRMETAGGAAHRVVFREKAIGCENCHGPGSLHQELHRSRKHAPGQDDLTIVNPKKLTRSLQEAICSNCHLSGPATVLLRGRGITDYRPGRPLTDYRIDYRFDSGNEQMTVVGHVEQLRHSACYQHSADLTCLTCHDPHASRKPTDTIAYYRQKCLNCHTTLPCKLSPETRRLKDSTDNCVACHMPRGDTDIPHVAFTHHRIGRHTAQTAGSAGAVPGLVATDENPMLTPVEQKRNLGMAYLKAFQNPVYMTYKQVFHKRAQDLLEEVQAAGLREGLTSAALAELAWPHDLERVGTFARQAVESKDVPPDLRARALLMLASCEMQQGDFPSARGKLEELVQLRRDAEDWRFLGICHLAQQEPQEAMPALQKALTIRPYRPAVHDALARVYRLLGEFRLANDHQEKARWLSQHDQD